jgi:glutamate/tyrosine decarboxylase-like PLP-dependent enzyme
MNSSSPSTPLQSLHQTAPIELAGEIAARYTQGNTQTPITPYRSPAQLESQLDLAITDAGEPVEQVMEALEALINATPRSTSKRFYNQLFSGQDPVATAADMLAPVLNTSLYTFKAAGPMTMIEQLVIRRMAHLANFAQAQSPVDGIFTPGGSISNLIAMLIGRNQACPTFRNAGAQGKALTSYASTDAHYSIVKNAGILGIGRDMVRQIPTDDTGAMNPVLLRKNIEADIKNNCLPSSIIATAGTTVRGAFDPIDQIASIAKEFGIWLHVDACFGGAAALSPNHRHLLAGVQHADSLAWNPHKVMGVPLSCAALITRQPDHLQRNLDETAEYLFQADDDALNPGTRSIQCGRRNDALKVWAAWKHHGDIGYQNRMDHLMNIAAHCAQSVRTNDAMTLTCDPTFVNVCFEVIGKSSKDICDLLRERNELLVGHALVNNRHIIRVPFVNGELTAADVDEMLDLILDAARSLPEGDNAVD